MALTALLASSCAKTVGPDESKPTDNGWSNLNGPVPISFATKMAPQETKTTSPLPTSADFRIFAFYQQGIVDDDPAVDYTGTWNDLAIQQWTPNFMYNEEVTYNDVTGKWTYSPVKYWPNNAENTITFWAYSPYYGNESILKLYKNNSADDYANNVPGVPEVQFTNDGTRDLLVSELAQDLSYKGGDPATVTLIFHHTMAWVDFRVKKADDGDLYDIVLKSITLEDLCQTASLKLSGWGAGWDRGTYTAYSDVTGTALDKDERTTFPTGGNKLLVIPQGFRGTSAYLSIVYTFHLKGSSSPATEYEEHLAVYSLSSMWEAEKHYTYNLNISPGNPIQFTAVAASWDSEQNGYFNVN